MSVIKSIEGGENEQSKPIKKARTGIKKAAPKKVETPANPTVVVHADNVIVPHPAAEGLLPNLNFDALKEKIAETHIESNISHTVEEVEEKAVGLWGRIKSWKYFWWVIVGIVLAVITFFVVSNYIRGQQIRKSQEKIETANEKIKQIEVGGDTTLLQLRFLQIQKNKRLDSLADDVKLFLDIMKKRLEYENSMPLLNDNIKEQILKDHERNNNPGNSDDDIRDNLRRQMPKQQAIPGGQTAPR